MLKKWWLSCCCGDTPRSFTVYIVESLCLCVTHSWWTGWSRGSRQNPVQEECLCLAAQVSLRSESIGVTHINTRIRWLNTGQFHPELFPFCPLTLLRHWGAQEEHVSITCLHVTVLLIPTDFIDSWKDFCIIREQWQGHLYILPAVSILSAASFTGLAV